MPTSTAKAKTRTYYGEYTLKHWIDLILSKNIILPRYQRSFVWEPNDVKKLMYSLDRGSFVPSITIAYDSGSNTILDGQQRLTSLLLACLNRYPVKDHFLNEVRLAPTIAEGEGDVEGEERDPLLWTFDKLVQKLGGDSGSRENLRRLKDFLNEDLRKAEKAVYKELDIASSFRVKDDGSLPEFYSTHYIGFTYIVYEESTAGKANGSLQAMTAGRYFAELFRSLNYTGKSLTREESRRALYFRNPEFTDFFVPKVSGVHIFSGLRVKVKAEVCFIDWIRYLAILTAYQVNKSEPLKHYSSLSAREDFFADYVSWVVGLEQDRYPEKFGERSSQDANGSDQDVSGSGQDTSGSNQETNKNDRNRALFEGHPPLWKDRCTHIKECLEKIPAIINEDSKNGGLTPFCFPSLIDADYWLFGLINLVLFEGKRLADEHWLPLKEAIQKHVEDAKGSHDGSSDSSHLKGINDLKYTYQRLRESIMSYEQIVKLKKADNVS
jgi:Protein of unknown function DUF262.